MLGIFLLTGLKSLRSFSFKFQFYFLGALFTIFFGEVNSLQTKKLILTLMPDISKTKEPSEKKSKLKQKDAISMYNPQNLQIRTFKTFFYKFSIS